MNIQASAPKILIVKTSSLGDIIHTFPAITDLIKFYPHAQLDWVVDESFAELPALHPAIYRVIPIALRAWRKNLRSSSTIKDILRFGKTLRQTQYDYIIDAQGLLKSAVITKLAKKISNGKRYGLDAVSSRGKYLNWSYDKAINIPKDQHAINRVKLLFSKIFNYPYQSRIDYGLNFQPSHQDVKPYLVFLHCTTWESKKWPVAYWRELISMAINNGYKVKLNSGNQQEFQATQSLVKGFSSLAVEVMPPQAIINIAKIIGASHGVVCVDTGLGHLAAALGIPGVGIYGSTNPTLTAIMSHNFTSVAVDYPCAPCLLRNCNKLDVTNSVNPPCYSTVTPAKVWQLLNQYCSSSVPA